MMTATSYIRLVVALAVAALVLAPGSARAQSAGAESLFRDGKRLMKKGDIAQACDKFEAADHAEATASTELNLADCREKLGQFATAWATFAKAEATARRAGDTRREAEAHRRAAVVEPKLIHLTIAVPEEVRVDGLVIKRNGTAVDVALWNQHLPVDPAEYTISAEAPGHEPWSTSVVVKTKDKKVEVPALDPRPEARRAEPRRPAEPDGDAPTAARDRDAGADLRPAPSRWTGARKLSLVLVGVGVAAAGAGIGLGLHASSLESQSDATCDRPMCKSADAVALNRSARHYALAANLGFAAGGAAVVGAAVLWFLGAPRASGTTRPDDTAMSPTCGPGCFGFTLARSF
jgi:hypothetical protein